MSIRFVYLWAGRIVGARHSFQCGMDAISTQLWCALICMFGVYGMPRAYTQHTSVLLSILRNPAFPEGKKGQLPSIRIWWNGHLGECAFWPVDFGPDLMYAETWVAAARANEPCSWHCKSVCVCEWVCQRARSIERVALLTFCCRTRCCCCMSYNRNQ